MICASLDKGINVLSEKPLAINEDQLSRIEKSVNNSSAQLGVCFQNRYNESVLYIKEYFKNRTVTSAYANLTWCRDERYYASGAWRGTKMYEGGGVMINQAIHSLDLLQWICGMPEAVLAHISNNSLKETIEVEDTAFGIFSLESGGNFVIHATNAAKSSFPVYMAFNSGSDTVELSADNLIVNGDFVTKKNGAPIHGKAEWGSGHATLIGEFYRCLQSGEKFPIDFYEARNAIRLILRMYESNGATIKI
jgi:predicted dehydrogenase